ncbi:hypothetical protein M8J77_013103 [Diaphorina citri]|nr:hypothetical protein M8J77_013103 [Diaphorina citri]
MTKKADTDLLNKMIERLNSMNESMTNMQAEMNQINIKLTSVLKENEELKQEAVKREKIIKEMDKRMNLLEQRTRVNNIEICNFPQTPNEDLTEVVKAVGKTLKVNIKTEDIQVVHRVQRFNKETTKNIIVNFISRWKKMEIVNAAKSFTKSNKRNINSRDINQHVKESDIYIGDHLTPYNKKLLNKTKILAKEKGWRFVWVRDCTIHVRQNEGTRTYTMKDEEDLYIIQ